jgi:single-stranded DNA-specific DHH superfamily exonuclease
MIAFNRGETRLNRIPVTVLELQAAIRPRINAVGKAIGEERRAFSFKSLEDRLQIACQCAKGSF